MPAAAVVLLGIALFAIPRLDTRSRQVEIVSQERERTEQGHPAVLTGITGTDADGTPVRLLAIAVHGEEGNRTITVRLPAAPSGSPGALRTIQEIVGSFRTSPGSTGAD